MSHIFMWFVSQKNLKNLTGFFHKDANIFQQEGKSPQICRVSVASVLAPPTLIYNT